MMFEGSASTANHRELFAAICGSDLLAGVPSRLSIADKRQQPSEAWRSQCLHAAVECFAFWDDSSYRTLAGFSYFPRNELVLFQLPMLGDAHMSALAALPFEIAALTSPHRRHWGKAGRKLWGFSRGHVTHGWACAFRGAGHERLVSRRWLDFGPWRVIRLRDDTTFIQFHDLAIRDPEEAYAQAAPGHQRMGVDPIGGFIQGIDPDVIADAQEHGVFIAHTKTLEVPIAPGIEVTQQDMRVAAALRLYHRLHAPPAQRIERIAYVFMEKGDAYAHLHELWLRELECWYMDERGRHRIDADYRPTPNPPEWVKRLDARS